MHKWCDIGCGFCFLVDFSIRNYSFFRRFNENLEFGGVVSNPIEENDSQFCTPFPTSDLLTKSEIEILESTVDEVSQKKTLLDSLFIDPEMTRIAKTNFVTNCETNKAELKFPTTTKKKMVSYAISEHAEEIIVPAGKFQTLYMKTVADLGSGEILLNGSICIFTKRA